MLDDDGPAAEPTPKSPQLQELNQERPGGPNPGDRPTFRPERLSGPGTCPNFPVQVSSNENHINVKLRRTVFFTLRNCYCFRCDNIIVMDP